MCVCVFIASAKLEPQPRLAMVYETVSPLYSCSAVSVRCRGGRGKGKPQTRRVSGACAVLGQERIGGFALAAPVPCLVRTYYAVQCTCLPAHALSARTAVRIRVAQAFSFEVLVSLQCPHSGTADGTVHRPTVGCPCDIYQRTKEGVKNQFRSQQHQQHTARAARPRIQTQATAN